MGTSLADKWICCSEWVPSESKQLIKTLQYSLQFTTSDPHTPVHKLMSCETKSSNKERNNFIMTPPPPPPPKKKCVTSGVHNNTSSSNKMLIDRLEWCELFVDYCDVFIRCLDSHSDGTHSLHRIHWGASNVMLQFSKSVLMKKQTHLHLGCAEGEYIFSTFSGRTISLSMSLLWSLSDSV